MFMCLFFSYARVYAIRTSINLTASACLFPRFLLHAKLAESQNVRLMFSSARIGVLKPNGLPESLVVAYSLFLRIWASNLKLERLVTAITPRKKGTTSSLWIHRIDKGRPYLAWTHKSATSGFIKARKKNGTPGTVSLALCVYTHTHIYGMNKKKKSEHSVRTSLKRTCSSSSSPLSTRTHTSWGSIIYSLLGLMAWQRDHFLPRSSRRFGFYPMLNCAFFSVERLFVPPHMLNNWAWYTRPSLPAH